MRFPGFVGQSYTLATLNYECQRSMNLYPEKDEIGTGKDSEVKVMYGTPGNSLLQTIGNGPIRGIWLTSAPLNGNTNQGILFVVSGNGVYTVPSNLTTAATLIGTLQTTTGPVSMADNGIQLFIVDGTNGYYVTLLTPTTVTQTTDPNWLGSNIVTYQDGYFIFCAPYSKEFYLSDLNAVTFTAPANASKEGYPDNIVSIVSSNRNLWLIGDQTTEVWFDSGNNQNPFQYIQGTMSQVGCAAPYSVTKMANSIFWLGKDETGTGLVFQANGYTPQRISTHAIELAFEGYPTVSDAIGFSYQENGHVFYVLTFPTASATWCYDTLTNSWHERSYLTNGQFTRIRANCYAFAFGTHIVGDYANGNIYEQSLSFYSDNGNPISRQRTAPHISKDMNRIRHNSFQLDFEAGTGLDGIQQGTNPQAILEWSDDGGHKWSNQHWQNLCPIGATNERTIWRRLGISRNRVYRLTITDPVKVAIIGAELEVEELAS